MKKRALQIGYILLPIFLLSLFFLTKDLILSLSYHLPSCPFYRYTGFYCPACGNTRSVRSLLEGDILSALQYNIVPLTLLVLGSFLYGELGTALFGMHKRLLPREGIFWIIFGILMATYFVGRNFFLPAWCSLYKTKGTKQSPRAFSYSSSFNNTDRTVPTQDKSQSIHPKIPQRKSPKRLQWRT